MFYIYSSFLNSPIFLIRNYRSFFYQMQKKISFNLRLTLIFKAKPCCSNLDLFRSCIAMMHFYNFLVVLPIPTTIHIQMYYFITVCVHLCGVDCDFFCSGQRITFMSWMSSFIVVSRDWTQVMKLLSHPAPSLYIFWGYFKKVYTRCGSLSKHDPHRLIYCGGLSKNGPHRLTYLNTLVELFGKD